MKPKSLRKNYLFNDDDYMGEVCFKIILTQDDKATLQAIVSKSPLSDAVSKPIVENYQYFSDKMHSKSFDPAVFWRGVGNLQIFDTELSPVTDNAQLIFESMNSKGKPLTPIDLIRNYILMSLPSDEQMKLYEGYWRPIEQLFGHEPDNEFNAFIWYWLWLKVPNRKPREDEAYDEFKTYCQDEGLEGDPEGLHKELREYARRYANNRDGRAHGAQLQGARQGGGGRGGETQVEALRRRADKAEGHRRPDRVFGLRRVRRLLALPQREARVALGRLHVVGGSTGESRRQGKITKEGSSYLRHALVEGVSSGLSP